MLAVRKQTVSAGSQKQPGSDAISAGGITDLLRDLPLPPHAHAHGAAVTSLFI